MNPQQQKRCQELAEELEGKFISVGKPNSGQSGGVVVTAKAIFEAGYQAALQDCEARERVAIEALEKVQAHGLHHYEDCKNREYDDQLCNCGMEKAELAVMNALAKLRGGVDESTT